MAQKYFFNGNSLHVDFKPFGTSRGTERVEINTQEIFINDCDEPHFTEL